MTEIARPETRSFSQLIDREDHERVAVQLWYNGGFPRTHCVSVGFLRRLELWLDQHPKLDVEWRLMR